MDGHDFERLVQREVQRQLAVERRKTRGMLRWAWLAFALSVPLAVSALPERLSWAAGDAIVADEINQNFENLWTAVEALEAAPTIGFEAEGFFEVLTPANWVAVGGAPGTVLTEKTIDAAGAGHVQVVGSVSVVCGSETSLWVNVAGDGTPLKVVTAMGSATTVPANTSMTATAHNVFRVSAAGTYSYSVGAISSDCDATAAHLSLMFVPD